MVRNGDLWLESVAGDLPNNYMSDPGILQDLPVSVTLEMTAALPNRLTASS